LSLEGGKLSASRPSRRNPGESCWYPIDERLCHSRELNPDFTELPYSNILIISAAEVVTLHVLHDICNCGQALLVSEPRKKRCILALRSLYLVFGIKLHLKMNNSWWYTGGSEVQEGWRWVGDVPAGKEFLVTVG